MAVKSNFKAVIGKLKDRVDKVTLATQMAVVADEMARLIRDRTRSGFGVLRDGGDKQKLKPLSKRYIAQRKKMHLSGFTTASKSNLTLTGQMLESLTTINNSGNGKVTIAPRGQRLEGNETNENVAKYVSKVRPFIFLSRIEIAQLIKFFEKNVLGPVLRGR